MNNVAEKTSVSESQMVFSEISTTAVTEHPKIIHMDHLENLEQSAAVEDMKEGIPIETEENINSTVEKETIINSEVETKIKEDSHNHGSIQSKSVNAMNSITQPMDRKSLVARFREGVNRMSLDGQTVVPEADPYFKNSPFYKVKANGRIVRRKISFSQNQITRYNRQVNQYKEAPNCRTCYLYEDKAVRPFPITSNTAQYPTDKKMNVTLISVLTYERIPMISYMVKRWSGLGSCIHLMCRPIVLSLFAAAEDLKKVTRALDRHNISPSVKLLIMVRKHDSTFPINRLRNLAISLVTTSHFLVLDMDMFPSRNPLHQI